MSKFWKSVFSEGKSFNPIQDGLFGGCSRLVGGKTDTKIGYTYPTMVKLATVISHLKKIQNIYELRAVPLQFC